jgi:hypothetical protein
MWYTLVVLATRGTDVVVLATHCQVRVNFVVSHAAKMCYTTRVVLATRGADVVVLATHC